MRHLSPLFLALLLGIAGYFVGGLAGMFGYLWVYRLLHPPTATGVEGEFAFPYGFAASLVGLIAGAWLGMRLGRSRSPD